MPRIRIMLEGDDGQPLSNSPDQLYPLESACDNLSQIEGAIERFRRSALPELERQLLQSAQDRQIAREKGGTAGD
jgi:hypothetical protein